MASIPIMEKIRGINEKLIFKLGDVKLNSNNIRKLPITYPPITSFTGYAHGLSIISTMEETHSWVYQNFTQLLCMSGPSNLYLYFNLDKVQTICPWLDTRIVQRDVITQSENNLIDFLIKNIDRGNYINLVIDHYFIPSSRSFNKFKFPHDILIFGYDCEEKTFDVADFFTGKYTFEKVSFSGLENAFNSIDSNSDHFNGIMLISLKNEVSFEFNKNLLIDTLKEYLNSTAIFEIFPRPDEQTEVGLNIYILLKDYIRNIAASNKILNFHPFHNLYDHKHLMRLRMQYLEKEGHLQSSYCNFEQFKDIERKALVLRNLVLKSIITKKIDSEMLINKLNEIQDLERVAVNNIIEGLLEV